MRRLGVAFAAATWLAGAAGNAASAPAGPSLSREDSSTRRRLRDLLHPRADGESVRAQLEALDESQLNEDQRLTLQAKRALIAARRRVAAGKARGRVRRAGLPREESCVPADVGTNEVIRMLKMGFSRLTPRELAFVRDRTGCSDCELAEEGTLHLYREPARPDNPKKALYRPRLQLLMHPEDPFFGLVEAYRSGDRNAEPTAACR